MQKPEDGDIGVLGATAWCWSRQDFEQSVDVLIVDGAGQMSLSNVLAVAPAGRSLVLRQMKMANGFYRYLELAQRV